VTSYKDTLAQIKKDMQASASSAYAEAQKSAGSKLTKLQKLTEKELQQQIGGGKGSSEYQMYEKSFEKQKSEKLAIATAQHEKFTSELQKTETPVQLEDFYSKWSSEKYIEGIPRWEEKKTHPLGFGHHSGLPDKALVTDDPTLKLQERILELTPTLGEGGTRDYYSIQQGVNERIAHAHHEARTAHEAKTAAAAVIATPPVDFKPVDTKEIQGNVNKVVKEVAETGPNPHKAGKTKTITINPDGSVAKAQTTSPPLEPPKPQNPEKTLKQATPEDPSPPPAPAKPDLKPQVEKAKADKLDPDPVQQAIAESYAAEKALEEEFEKTYKPGPEEQIPINQIPPEEEPPKKYEFSGDDPTVETLKAESAELAKKSAETQKSALEAQQKAEKRATWEARQKEIRQEKITTTTGQLVAINDEIEAAKNDLEGKKERRAVKKLEKEKAKILKKSGLTEEQQQTAIESAKQVANIEKKVAEGELGASAAQTLIKKRTGEESTKVAEQVAKEAAATQEAKKAKDGKKTAKDGAKKANEAEKASKAAKKKAPSPADIARAAAREAKEVGNVVFKCRQLAGCSMDPTFNQSDLKKMRDQLSKTPFNSSDNANSKGTTNSDWGSDALANKAGAIIRISHLASNFAVSFKAFVSEYGDRFDSKWNKQDVFGRVDPVMTYQNTERTIQLGWAVPSFGVCEAICNLERVSLLMKMLYPEYRNVAGTKNVSGIVSAPLLQLEFRNMINSTSGPNGLTVVSSGFNMEPDLEMGFFGDDLGNYYPKVINLSSTFTVLHNHTVGWRRRGKYLRLTKSFNNYPYGVKPSRVQSLPFEKPIEPEKDTTDAANSTETGGKPAEGQTGRKNTKAAIVNIDKTRADSALA